jgi:hypothetical protein
MSFYDLSKDARQVLVKKINVTIFKELHLPKQIKTLGNCKDEDTYIRKSAYLAIGKIYFSNKELQPAIIAMLDAIEEIVDVHDRYKDFAVLTQADAQRYINEHFPL